MEISYCGPGIIKICHRLPRSLRNIVSHPIYKILNFAPSDPRVENVADFKLGQTVHLDGRRDLLDTAGERVGHMRLQEADVEDRMDMHGRRKIQAERRCPNLANDNKGTKATNIQLGGRTSRGDVASREPHLLSWEKCGRWTTATIG